MDSPLLHSLSNSPHILLQPKYEQHQAALALVKRYLDPVANSISGTQLRNYEETRRKRKRGENGSHSRPLQLQQVYLEGFGIEQVYEQVKKIMAATTRELEKIKPAFDALSQSQNKVQMSSRPGKKLKEKERNGVKAVRFTSDQSEDSSENDSLRDEGLDWEYDEVDTADDEVMQDGSNHLGVDIDGVDYEAESQAEEDIEADDMDTVHNEKDLDDNEQTTDFVADPNGLNDGFFSIDDFNKRSEFLEHQDARGDPNDGAASDEEEIDWDANPLAVGSKPGNNQDDTGSMDEDDLDEDGDGPTFGNADLNGVDSDEEDGAAIDDEEMRGAGALGNTNEIMYSDFFTPPARKASKKKRGRPNPHNFPDANTAPKSEALEGQEDDIQRAMSSVHRDLFDDALSSNESEEPLSDADPAEPKSRRSTHERRQAKLAEEIRRLEAANVAKREWTLSGEARAIDRPVNSLLEEDLEFERAGKPVPVITQEVTEDIESLIKRRILAQEFDEVVKRRPNDLATGPNARRGRQTFELDDTKPKQGLAEEYEQDHLRRADPSFVDVKNEKLKKEHKEIETLWKEISSRLDALSNWHYKPKPAAPNMEVRVDAPTITMEDARPAADGGDVGAASMLAPQEVYTPGEVRNLGEVVTKGGIPIGREEMSRDEKLRRRRRKKERQRKAGTHTEINESRKTVEKRVVLGDLKKGGVKVIGKKGDVVDIEGKKAAKTPKSGGAFKL